MALSHEHLITTRFSDLDPQRHINNSFYEIYTREARHLILQHHKYNYTRCVTEDLYIRPVATEVAFYRQQSANTPLKVITEYKQNKEGLIQWIQKIQNTKDDSVVCEMEHHTLLEKKNQLFVLDTIAHTTEPFKKFEQIPEFNNSCKHSTLQIIPRHTDLDGFKKIPVPVLWRYNEEARWKFIDDSGLSFHEMKARDRALFWIHGRYDYTTPAQLHSKITIHTWIRKMEGARIYIRQYCENSTNGEKIMDMQGEFLTVALSRSTPVRIPDFIQSAFEQYTENIKIKDHEN